MVRDDFSTSTKRRLAQRAGGRCSRPGCDKLCWLPGDGPEDVTSIGVAAHISAASEGGPRYDPQLTPAERCAIENGIWLCSNCSVLIDRDWRNYSRELLLAWKQKHEAQLRAEAAGVLLLPSVLAERIQGVSVTANRPLLITPSTYPGQVEHELSVLNDTDFDYLRIGFRVQWPEAIYGPRIRVAAPPGCEVQTLPDNLDYVVETAGSASVHVGVVELHPDITFEAGQLLVGQRIVLGFASERPSYTFDEEVTRGMIPFSVCGETQARIGGVTVVERFTTPLWYDKHNRHVRSGVTRPAEQLEDLCLTLRRF